MFKFFKNKNKEKPKKPIQDTQVQLTEEEKKEYTNELEKLKDKRNTHELTQGEKAQIDEKIGLLYVELNDLKQAIKYLEKSLESKPSIGEGFKKLMSLYNKERQKAAEEGDSDAIEKYMNKMDDMRTMAKKGTTSR